jgi:hypothetical protein
MWSYTRQEGLPTTNMHFIQIVEIILSLDANEAYNPETLGTVFNLTYTLGVPTYSHIHDGKFYTLVTSCNLLDPLSYQHPERLYPHHIYEAQTESITYWLLQD